MNEENMCLNNGEKERLFEAIREHGSEIIKLGSMLNKHDTKFIVLENTVKTSKSWVNILSAIVVFFTGIIFTGSAWYMSGFLVEVDKGLEAQQINKEVNLRQELEIRSLENSMSRHQVPDEHPDNSANVQFLLEDVSRIREDLRRVQD